MLRGLVLRARRTGVHILRGAHKRRLPGAQRFRVPGQHARRRQDPAGRFTFRPILHAPAPAAPNALPASASRVLPEPRAISRRRQAPGVRSYFQHGPKYVPARTPDLEVYNYIYSPDVDGICIFYFVLENC